MNVLTKDRLLIDLNLFANFWLLMEEAFPLDERRDEQSFKLQLLESDFFINLYVNHNNEPLAFISWWNLTSIRYVEHFMVSSTLRGEGVGSELFNDFLKKDDSFIILEVEPIIDLITERRINFYIRLGLLLLDFDYQQPPYHQNFPFKPMLLMSNIPDLDNHHLINLVHTIRDNVYRNFNSYPQY